MLPTFRQFCSGSISKQYRCQYSWYFFMNVNFIAGLRVSRAARPMQ